MRRLYFLTGSIDSARRITDELLLERIPETHIHIVTHTDELPEDLPEATSNELSDFFPGLFKGLGLGALAGLVAALALAFIPWFGLGPAMLINTPLLLAIVAFGALLGAFAGAITGISVPNHALDRFDPELDNGRILVIVDVHRDQADEIRRRVTKVVPDTRYCGVEPLKPAFP
ncbi:hypothetical protein J2T55_002203 [Methylohalomonas lacus]|uniref:DUF1269 domain-containing protein n=1 Tax=Methylohalomonas lacus TaxID=398773 RepID=A0AAE3HP04_9GAMM|nr:DUF1269 domain-containing protein [Methylohalomonas lacus]MCS3904168.1 hypothetical protein [Methylohalomonas lacus]